MTNPSLTLESVSYVLPDGRTLFTNITEHFDRQPTGLVGRNGIGKSVLARILAGSLEPSAGRCVRSGSVHYLAQQLSYHHYPTVAAVAGAQAIVAALQRIEAGSADPADFEVVGERWDIRQRLRGELDLHGLGHLDIDRPAASLSGGEAMRVALAGAFLSAPDILILDEPTNHLDQSNRRALLEQLRRWPNGLLVVSHDRILLEQMTRIVELSSLGLRSYGGSYSLYAQNKLREREDAQRQLEQRKLERRREEQAQREQRDRQEHRQARGDRRGRDANQAKILLGRQRERSEVSAGKMRAEQSATRDELTQRVRDAAQRIEDDTAIVIHSPASGQSAQRQIAELNDVALPFVSGATANINLRVTGRQRIGVTGPNGCGKSTLLKLFAGLLQPLSGECIVRVAAIYLDQHLTSLDPQRTVLQQLQAVNRSASESLLRTRLAQLGLDADRIGQPSGSLSGGERLKAALACALYTDDPAQLLLLDEPSNHLDLASTQALEAMLRQYQGALIVVSHDEAFLQQLELTGRLRATDRGWVLEV